MNTTDALLRGILATVGRTTFSPEMLYRIVAPTVGSAKQVTAYNLCDGQTAQRDICKKLKLDPGNLSRTIAKWIEAGIIVRIGEDDLPLHIYSLSPSDIKNAKKGANMAGTVEEKLDILIKLQAAALTIGMASSKEKILFLAQAGLRPTLIAEVLGTTANHVNVAISNARKSGKEKSS